MGRLRPVPHTGVVVEAFAVPPHGNLVGMGAQQVELHLLPSGESCAVSWAWKLQNVLATGVTSLAEAVGRAACGVGRSGSAGGSIRVQHKQQSSSALLVPRSDPPRLQAREGCPAACCWPAGLGGHLWHGSAGERGQRLNEKHLEIVLNTPVSFLIGCKHGRYVNAGSHLCLPLMVLSGQISALGSCLLSQADAGERWVIWGNALLVVNQQGAEVRAEKCSECCCRKPGTVAQSHDTIAA